MHDAHLVRLGLFRQTIHRKMADNARTALDNRLRLPGGAPLRLNLSGSDKAALVAFLRTLTDTSLANNPAFASPFRP